MRFEFATAGRMAACRGRQSSAVAFVKNRDDIAFVHAYCSAASGT
jgi:hypothetical protein